VAKRAVHPWADLGFILCLVDNHSLSINLSSIIWMSGNEDYYDPSLAENEERLVAVTVNLKRDSPPPPPPPPPPYRPNPSHKSRRKQVASQGDTVILNHMDPNRPDLAIDGGRAVLCTSPTPSPPRRRPPGREGQENCDSKEKGQGAHHSPRNHPSKEFDKEKALNSPGMRASKNTLFPSLIYERTSNSPELKGAETKLEDSQTGQKMMPANTILLDNISKPAPQDLPLTSNASEGPIMSVPQTVPKLYSSYTISEDMTEARKSSAKRLCALNDRDDRW
jgi:hypothetical protein